MVNKIINLSSHFSSTRLLFQIDILMREFELVVSEEHKFENRPESIKVALLKFLDCQNSAAQIGNSAIEKTTTGKVAIPTLMEEIKPGVLVKLDFESREK